MVKLGFWQLDRAQQKQALFNDYQQQQDTNIVTRLAAMGHSPKRFQAVSVTGTFDPTRLFFIDNQLNEGVPGYHVVALFHDDNIATPIAINLGWVKAPQSRQQLPRVEVPQGTYTLTGLVKQPQQNVFVEQTVEQLGQPWPKRVQEFIPANIQATTGIAMQPYLLLLAEEHDIGYQRSWQPNVMPPEKHQAYALQWFSLAVACLVIFVIAVIKRSQQKQEETP